MSTLLSAVKIDFPLVADPVHPLPSRVELEAMVAKHGPGNVEKALRERHGMIQLRERDPLRYAIEKWKPAIWDVCDNLLVDGRKIILLDPPENTPREIIGGSEVLAMGGNRCGKTEFIAYRCIRTLVEKPGARTWSFHTTDQTSIAIQQPRFYKYLPPEWRGAKAGKVTNFKYTQKTGFSENTFVCPNGAQHWFKNYKQDPATIEGEELDGAATDELVPLEVVETLRYRLATRKGWLLIIFTPIEGWSPTVRGLCDGARTIVSAKAPLLPINDAEGKVIGCERVPRVQQAVNAALKVVYFHVQDNPFSGAEDVIKRARVKGREELLCRVYGVPTKEMRAMFPRFSEEIHVIDLEIVPAKGSDYHYCDPCSGRNWFMLWVRALPNGDRVVWREWPQEGSYIPGIGDPGAWAEPDGKKHDGKRGPAQSTFGWGLERYRDEILRIEGWKWNEQIKDIEPLPDALCEEIPGRKPVEVLRRYMDSRYGASPTLARNETTTLIEQMSDIGIDFEPASGEHQREGLDMINTALDFEPDPADPDRRRFLRKPRLYITRNCANLIYAIKTWTGADGKEGATKDPIDVLRYAELSEPMYIDPESMRGRPGAGF